MFNNLTKNQSKAIFKILEGRKPILLEMKFKYHFSDSEVLYLEKLYSDVIKAFKDEIAFKKLLRNIFDDIPSLRDILTKNTKAVEMSNNQPGNNINNNEEFSSFFSDSDLSILSINTNNLPSHFSSRPESLGPDSLGPLMSRRELSEINDESLADLLRREHPHIGIKSTSGSPYQMRGKPLYAPKSSRIEISPFSSGDVSFSSSNKSEPANMSSFNRWNKRTTAEIDNLEASIAALRRPPELMPFQESPLSTPSSALTEMSHLPSMSSVASGATPPLPPRYRRLLADTPSNYSNSSFGTYSNSNASTEKSHSSGHAPAPAPPRQMPQFVTRLALPSAPAHPVASAHPIAAVVPRAKLNKYLKYKAKYENLLNKQQ